MTGTPLGRLIELAAEWSVTIDARRETATSLIGTGARGSQPVVVKVVKHENDEWHAGEILHAFRGHGMVRVLEWTDGAMLLERLTPGTRLADTACEDDAATDTIAGVIQAMSPSVPPPVAIWVDDLAGGFERYIESGDQKIPIALARHAHHRFMELCESQRNPRLLHGDLQHHNILRDQERGWVAIDPKGYIGEVEYELGAAFRNPVTDPDLVARRDVIARRLERYAAILGIDPSRTVAWVYAQAVLSAIWDVEDGHAVDATHASLRLAVAAQPMLTPG